MEYALEMAPIVRFLFGCAASSCLSGDLAERLGVCGREGVCEREGAREGAREERRDLTEV